MYKRQIYAIGRQDFLIKHITPHGLADGYILKKIDSVMHLEISAVSYTHLDVYKRQQSMLQRSQHIY